MTQPTTQPTTSEQPRLFVAVPIPAELRAAAAAAVAAMKARLPFKKWTHPDDLHITLKFIGETASASLPAIETELERVAARSGPFPLRLSRIGAFGAPQAPRVLWAGLDGELRKLKSLQADVERQLAAIGYEPENRPYSPHVTLARQYAGNEPARKEWLDDSPFLSDGESAFAWTADRLVLYRSHLGRSPMYEPLRTIAFHAGG